MADTHAHCTIEEKWSTTSPVDEEEDCGCEDDEKSILDPR
jgi:hypothetical protein